MFIESFQKFQWRHNNAHFTSLQLLNNIYIDIKLKTDKYFYWEKKTKVSRCKIIDITKYFCNKIIFMIIINNNLVEWKQNSFLTICVFFRVLSSSSCLRLTSTIIIQTLTLLCLYSKRHFKINIYVFGSV